MAPRKLIFYWFLYGLLALLLLLLQTGVLNHLQIWGVHPFILPCLVGVTAVYTSRKGSAVFAFFFGLLCDMLLLGAIPCFYLLTFTLCAFLAGLLSHRFILPGFFSALLAGTLSFLVTEILQMFFLSFRGDFPLLPGMALLLSEFLITLPCLVLLYPLYSRIDRFLSNI